MWGNLLGWCISAAMVVATAIALFVLNHSLNQISEPTSFSNASGAAVAFELPPGIDELLTKESGPADPASLYRQAIDQYNGNRGVFDDFAKAARRDELVMTQSTLDLLVQACGNLPAAIFADKPADIITYDSNSPLAALRTLGDCLNNAALFAKLSDKHKAQTEYDAVFALGARMARERLTYAELSDGLGLMSGAALELGELETDAKHVDRAGALNKFAASLKDFTTAKLTPVQSVLSAVDQNILEKHAGDYFWLAMNSKSKMWRVESILAVGRLKFDAPTVGDNRGAKKYLAQWSQTETDPAAKAAAVAANELTQEQYDKLH